MEIAIMNNSHAASKVMAKVPWFRGRHIHMAPYYVGRALQGYCVIVNGQALTENEVENAIDYHLDRVAKEKAERIAREIQAERPDLDCEVAQ